MSGTRALLLKGLLILGGVVQIGYWGISHLFFPGWYLGSIGLTDLAADPGETAIFLHEIGVLAAGMGLATILAARDPIKNFAIIVVLYAVGIGSVLVSLYHILFQGMAAGEWATVILISAQLILLTVLYPWREVRRQG